MDTTTIKRIGVVIGIVAIIVIAIMGIVRLATGDGEGQETATPQASLIDYDNDSSSVHMLYEGEIVAREEYREIRIQVSANRRRIEVIRGYDGTVLERKTYRNSQAAYSTFLRALRFEGFDESQDNELGDDHRGVCPDGNRTIVELYEDGTREFKLWNASCDDELGTLAGNERDIRELFEAQIPDFRDVTRGVRL